MFKSLIGPAAVRSFQGVVSIQVKYDMDDHGSYDRSGIPGNNSTDLPGGGNLFYCHRLTLQGEEQTRFMKGRVISGISVMINVLGTEYLPTIPSTLKSKGSYLCQSGEAENEKLCMDVCACVCTYTYTCG